MLFFDRHRHPFRATATQFSEHNFLGVFRGLVGHQATGDLGKGFAGNDGLGALALVAPTDAVKLEGRGEAGGLGPSQAGSGM